VDAGKVDNMRGHDTKLGHWAVLQAEMTCPKKGYLSTQDVFNPFLHVSDTYNT